MLTKQAILEALREWINQRPGLEFGNYGDWKAYRAELRHITRTRADALKLLQAVSWRDSITAENLIAAFPQAYSGRLALTEGLVPFALASGPAQLSYCTGQYWPTEYRAAAAAVLARALWYRASADMPAPTGTIIKDHGAGFKTESDNIEGFSPGDWLRRHFRREFGRGIQSRWFN